MVARRPASIAGTLVLGALLAVVPAASARSWSVTPPSGTAGSCATHSADGPGVARRGFRAQGDGELRATLHGPRGSDWDLAVLDADTGRLMAGSASFGADEIGTARLTGGQAVVLQACRRSGRGRAARLEARTFAVAPRPPGIPSSVRLVRVTAVDALARARLRRLGLDLVEHSTPGTFDAVLYGPGESARLAAAGLPHRVLVDDLVARDRSERAAERRATRSRSARAGARAATVGGRTTYRTLPEYQQELKRLAARHPRLVRRVTLPGRSLEGRPLEGIEIASGVGRPDDGRPVLVVFGLIHAREWPAGEATMEWALDLVNGYRRDARLTRIVRRARTFVIPVVNPDGFDASIRSGDDSAANLDEAQTTVDSILGRGAYKRKNCRTQTPEQAAVPCPARGATSPDPGVDLNRNFATHWGGLGTSTGIPALDNYAGAGPFSEPETQSLRRWLRGLQPVVSISNHTFTGLVLRPPGLRTAGTAPDEQRLKALGDAMAAQTGYASVPGYILYDTTGTAEDWAYEGLGSLAFVPEIGRYNFHPAYSTGFLPEYDGRDELDAAGRPTGRRLGGLREAFTLAGLATLGADSHALLVGRAPPGRELRLHRSFTSRTSGGPDDQGATQPAQTLTETHSSRLAVGPSGSFRWHVLPSRRPYEAAPGAPWALDCRARSGRLLERRLIRLRRGDRVGVRLHCRGRPFRQK